ncbi:T9SS type A sorting domain-containing protein [Flavobacterium gelatinilyticum]|uniref:T9SS type A sorting domain-containing protein n=1 Tax=Flavobacterium gelatinilyticum TaxID=3003260 RepID=UPI002480D3C4|nr:T9SS type A sorting domain-containing protein [Flavobacterium gelatinilyticum]
MKHFYSQIKKFLNIALFLGIFLQSYLGNSQATNLTVGQLIFTGFDSNYPAADGDEFSFVCLVALNGGTTINFTDRGYSDLGAWSTTNPSEGTVKWVTGASIIPAGTEIIVKGLQAFTYDIGTSSRTPNGTVTRTDGTMPNGLNLSAFGDQIIAFQGGGDIVTGPGALLIGGLHYYICPEGTTQSGWDDAACADGTNGSTMPPGLVGGTSAFYPGGTDQPSAGKFNIGSGAPVNNAANLRTSLMTQGNWTLSQTTISMPSGAPFLAAPTTITTQPLSKTVCSGSNTSFSVVAGGTVSSYQWQVDTHDGSGFVNLTNTAPYSGAFTATLNITGITSSMSGNSYRVIVTGSGSVTSNAAIASVPAPLTSLIQSQSNVSIYGGNNGAATLTVSGGTTPYFYSWSPSGGTGSGASNLSAGTYTVTITDSTPNGLGGCSTTQTVTITQPAGIIVSTTSLNPFTSCTGGVSTTQNFTVSGGNLTANVFADAPTGFEISTDAVNYSDNITLTPQNGNLSATTIYVRLANTATGTPAGNITFSSPTAVTQNVAVTGTVTPAPAIVTQPSSSTICSGGNTTFAATASNATGGYRWEVNQGLGFIPITDNAIYSGATTATLSITGATAGMNGFLYHLVATGSCTPDAISNNVALTVNSAPAITAQPSSSTICSGENTTFAATAANTTTYQWEVNNGTGSGFTPITDNSIYSGAATATLAITNATAAMNGFLYRLAASGTCSPAATSNNAALTVNSAPAITSQPSNSSICNGANTAFSAVASNASGYQWYVNEGLGFASVSDGGVYSGATTGTLTITGAPVAMNGFTYRVVASGSCTPAATSNDVTLTVNPSPAITSQPTAGTTCAGGNATFTVAASSATGYQWYVNDGAGFNPITNGGVYSGATGSTLTITGATASMNGFLYHVAANGTCTPSATSNNAVLTVNSAPAITAQPASSTICEGENTIFAVTADNAASYRWQVNQGFGYADVPPGAPYSGETTATLTITNAAASLNGFKYQLIVNGVCLPAATSNEATLTINSAPQIITNPASVTACIGSNVTLSAAAVNQGGYQWQVNEGAGFGNITNGGVYSGATTASLTITGATAGMNNYSYRVVAAGICSPPATSSAAVLTVPTINYASTQVNIACNGAANGSLSVTPSGGSTPYTYLWSNSATTSSISNLAPGNYDVTITDANSCQTTASFTISEPSALALSQASLTNVSCNNGANGTATVSVSGGTPGYTYSWAPYGGTNATATGLSAGTFTVTVTDAYNCSSTLDFEITQPDALSVTPSQTNILCNGTPTGSASVTVTGGTGTYTYAWAPSGGTASTATGLTAGTYTVTITDANNCQATESFTITEPAVLTAIPVAQTNIACYGDATGSASVTASGGTGTYTYSWAPSGGTASTAIGLSAGTYVVTITDVNSCTATQAFTITEPSAPLSVTSSSTPVSCFGGANGTATVSVSGGTLGYTYSWAPYGGTASTAIGLEAGPYTVTITDANGCTLTENVTVGSPAQFAATFTKTDVSCNGGVNGTATITATGATFPYTYSWAPYGGTAATATGLAAGTFTVTIEDANGCVYQESVTINENAPVGYTQSQTNVLCNGTSTGSATVTASGGTGTYTYVWSPSGGTAATATGLSVGNYSVLITDGNGCVATANFMLTEPAVLDAVTSQTDATCSTGGEAEVTPNGGTTPYSYLWSDGQTTAAATGLTAGNYSVVITDANGCTITKNFTIGTTNTLVATTSQTDVLCNGGNTGSASVVPSGAVGPFTYVWSPSGGTADTATGLTAGNYSVTITAGNGCSIVKNFTISEPSAIAISPSQTNVTCNQGSNGSATVSVTGGTGSYTYSWAPAGGTSATATGLTAGIYTVTVTDANLCTATETITITEPDAIIATPSKTDISCNGGVNGTATVTVTGGTGAYTYSWAPYGGTAATATGLAAGTFTVTITDANGCTGTQDIIIIEPAAITASIVQTDVTCNGLADGSATVTAAGGTGAYTYSWAPSGGTAETASGLAAGIYTVTITDANGCTGTQSVTIAEPTALTAAISHTDVTCNLGSDGSATVSVSGGTAGYTYSWAPSGGTAATATGLTAGIYTVTVTDANGCTATENVTIAQPTAIDVTAVTTNVTCNGDSNGSIALTVTGGTGAYTYSWLHSGETTSAVSGLAAGDYIATVTDANGCFSSLTITINEPAVLAATVSKTDVSCNGGVNGTATATVTGGTGAYTYSWAPYGGTAATAAGLAAGTFTVTITDANGCTATQTIAIAQPALLIGTITGTDVSCPGSNDGTAAVVVTGGMAPYTYSWSPSGGTADTATGLTAGIYTVTITDANGCTATQTITIGVADDTTAPVPTVANLPQITGFCSVLAAEIAIPTATDTCAGTINGTTTDPLNYTAAGTYTITWTYDDGNGNTSSQNQTVVVSESPLEAVTFNNAVFTYDGTAHSAEVENLPAGATVAYSANNGAVNAGTYQITATITPAATSPNCSVLVLTADLIINKAPQQITFDAIPVKTLGVNNTFDLDATSSSGLAVTYTSTFDSPQAPATVSADGEVTMLTSGEILITAHQEGDNNYLPADEVSRLLVILNNNIDVARITIGNKIFENPAKVIYHLLACGETNPNVSVVNESNAIITPAPNFTIQTPKPGIYTQDVNITSQDGSASATYTLTVEKPFGFFDIVQVKFNNVLIVNNNPNTNGGYQFTAYQWFKNGQLIGTGQYYSAGETQGNVLDPTADYMVKMTTADGKVLQTCTAKVLPTNTLQARIYPNPVAVGKVVTIDADFPQEELDNMEISLYNVAGQLVKTVKSSTAQTEIQLPQTADGNMFLVVLQTPNVTKSFKVIVK